MKFPQFPKNYKQHMPFVTVINDVIYFFVCMCQLQSNKWKIYWWHNNEYIRVTKNANDVECNPVFSLCNDKLILSYVKSQPYKKRKIVCLQLINDNFQFVQQKEAAIGCYFKGNYYIPENNIINGVDLSKYEIDYIYAIRFCEKGMLVTISKDKDRDTLLIDENKKIYKLISNGKSVYKPTMINEQWFKVITLKGNYQELRYVIKDKNVQLESL